MFGYLFVLQIIGVVYSKTCYYRRSYYSYSSSRRSKYCIYGCCSSYSSNPCCSSSYSSYTVSVTISTAQTVAIVIGSLIALSIFFSIVFCICKSMRGLRGVQGQVLTQPPVAYITNSGSITPSTYPQTAFPPTFGNNGNIMDSTEQLNVIQPYNGNTAYPPTTENTAYPPSTGNIAYPPSNGNTAYPPSTGTQLIQQATTTLFMTT